MGPDPLAPPLASRLQDPPGMLYEIATPTGAGYRDVSPAALCSATGTTHVVDVRESHELSGELGHIRGVDHVPLAALAARAGAWRRDEEVVLVCRSGARSSQAARILVAAGFQKVMNLAGGMLAYTAAGLPVARR
jgi:rhodanese-related sulfurtransferase